MMNTVSEMKTTLQGINSGVDETEDQIRDLQYKEAENIQSEWQKEKRIQKSEDGIKNLWDNFTCTNICIMVVAERKEREQGIKNLCDI